MKDVSSAQYNSYFTDYNLSEGILLLFFSITPIFSSHSELLLDYWPLVDENLCASGIETGTTDHFTAVAANVHLPYYFYKLQTSICTQLHLFTCSCTVQSSPEWTHFKNQEDLRDIWMTLLNKKIVFQKILVQLGTSHLIHMICYLIFLNLIS